MLVIYLFEKKCRRNWIVHSFHNTALWFMSPLQATCPCIDSLCIEEKLALVSWPAFVWSSSCQHGVNRQKCLHMYSLPVISNIQKAMLLITGKGKTCRHFFCMFAPSKWLGSITEASTFVPTLPPCMMSQWWCHWCLPAWWVMMSHQRF